MIKKIISILVILLAVFITLGCTDTSSDTSLENEIKNGVVARDVNISYTPETKTLEVDLYAEYVDAIFMDTRDILKIVKTHPEEIKTVKVSYETMLLDENKNEHREEVLAATFDTEDTNVVNWEKVYVDEAKSFLSEHSVDFNLHPALR